MSEATYHEDSFHWPSVEAHNLDRQQFMQLCTPTVEEIVKSARLFRDLKVLNEREQAVFALSRFMFGTTVVDKPTESSPFVGLKKTDNEILCPYFGFDVGGNYVFNRTWLVSLIRKSHLASVAPMVRAQLGASMELGDFAEISGVEEGAHRIFLYHKPGYLEFHTRKPLDAFRSIVEYDAQDHETRALLWKLGYIKRYFPHYYAPFKAHYDEVVQFRREKKFSH